jgi:hypothetical protein
MLQAGLERLDRQLGYLLDLSDEDFLFAAQDFLSALEADPQLAIHLRDLEHEADDLGQKLHEDEYGDGEASGLLLRVWEDLGSQLQQPQLGVLLERNGAFKGLFGYFEHPAVVPLDVGAGSENSSRTGQLLDMIEKLDVSEGHVIIETLRGPYEVMRAEQAAAHTRLLRVTRTHPGVALLRLRCLASLDTGGPAEARSRPRKCEASPMLVVRADAHGRRWSGLILGVLHREQTIASLGDGPILMRGLRGAAERLGLELRGRIGTTRSRLAVIERYQARCEWHDRQRLQTLAEEAAGAREHALRDDLARYLFDQGLNPLSEAVLGAHARADLFQPEPRSGFLLEAKQYSDRTSLSTALAQAFRQALDTAGNLTGSGYEVEEAFIVLFRRGGPRAVLPREPIEADGRRWYLRLINIAPPADDASRNRYQPLEYSVEDLRTLLIEQRSALSEG